MGLLPGQYTPQLQASMTRLGSKLTFSQAVEEIWYSHKSHVPETTLRRITCQNGAAAEALARQEVEALERDAPPSPAHPHQLMVSIDGAYVQIVNGEWREVKSVAIGEFETVWNEATWEAEVKTGNISYFSRSYRARDFERYALGELHRRGLENAEKVVGLGDGAAVNQSFLDYHCPNVERIIDFSHTTTYLANAGKAIWDEGSESFKQWYAAACHLLKHKPPQQTVANLRLLLPKAKSEEQAMAVNSALFYIESRLDMMDYVHFRHCGYPIGSGSVESGHKVVVQQRMKGAGMRWAEHHLDPMLTLRNLVCNGRWEEGWQQTVLFRQEQQVVKCLARAEAKQQPPEPPSKPLTLASLKAAGLLPTPDEPNGQSIGPTTSKRPAEDHPWRMGIWPTYESWRWN